MKPITKVRFSALGTGNLEVTVDRKTDDGWKAISCEIIGSDAYGVREALTIAIETLEKALPDPGRIPSKPQC